jgi:hypothetical protein
MRKLESERRMKRANKRSGLNERRQVIKEEIRVLRKSLELLRCCVTNYTSYRLLCGMSFLAAWHLHEGPGLARWVSVGARKPPLA